MKAKALWITAAVLALLSLLFIAVVLTVDVQPIGPNGTTVGLATINRAGADRLGFNQSLYDFSNYAGGLCLLTVGAFAVVGLIQWIRRKNLFKVDQAVLAMGVLYVIVAVLYVLFDRVAINYRPIVLLGSAEPETSFPSSHTMLACTVMGSTVAALQRLIPSVDARRPLQVLSVTVLIVTLGCRLLSGAHWLTDIVGGILISATLLCAYVAAITPTVAHSGRHFK